VLRTVIVSLFLLVLALVGASPLPAPPPPNAPAARVPAATLYDTIRTDLRAYSWPMRTSRAMTSSFGEYRTTHFHAGMDISTGDTIGLPVIAARAGYISRITISASGYGKLLYIRHPDGYTTTYAHLFGFPDWLQAAVHEAQMRAGRYPIEIDFPPTRFPVTAGQVVALAGESGSGSAHLHFEIRDENNNTINPLLTSGISITDDMQPVFRGGLFVPLRGNARVNGSHELSRVAVREQRSGVFTLNGTPVIAGKVGFAVDVRDRSNLSRFLHGFHHLRLYIDSAQVMGVSYDRVPLRDGNQIRLVYVRDDALRSRDHFHKLYIDTYHRLPIFPGFGPGSGIIQTDRLAIGTHTLRVECEDFNGNISVLTGTFRTESPGPEVPPPPASPGTIHVDPDAGGSVRPAGAPVTVRYEPGAVFSPADITVEALDADDADGFAVEPHGLPLDGGLQFRMKAPADCRYMGAYTRGGGSWQFQSRVERDSVGMATVELHRFLGDVAFIEDRVPPSIFAVSVKGNGPKPSISFRFRDNLSGVEYKEVMVYIDAIMVIPEIDGEHRRASAEPLTPLTKGSHRLTIRVSDRMGNLAEVERQIHVR
jgi:hypothetical protein